MPCFARSSLVLFLFNFRCVLYLFFFALISVSCHNSWFALYFSTTLKILLLIQTIAFLLCVSVMFVLFVYSFPFCFVLLSIFRTCCILLGRDNRGGVGGARKSERKQRHFCLSGSPSPSPFIRLPGRLNILQTLHLVQKISFLFLLFVFLLSKCHLFFVYKGFSYFSSVFDVVVFFVIVLLLFSLPSLAGTVSDMFCLCLLFFLVSVVFVFLSFLVRFKLS